MTKIEEYEALRTSIDIVEADIKQRITNFFGEELKDLERAKEKLSHVEKELRAEVFESGVTAVGSLYEVFRTKGKTTWDSQGLATYAELNPAILAYKKIGESSTTLRLIKKE